MGLFMGASLITVFEFLVYLFVKLYSFGIRQRLAIIGEETAHETTGETDDTVAHDKSVYI